MAATLDIDAVRASFPALASGYVFADNAGGSQCLRSVADRITDYLLRTNVQLGADYSVSVESTRRVAEGAQAAAALFNAKSEDEVAFGASSTMLVENLARGLEPDFKEGDEIVVTGEHEANCGPWKKLAQRRGLVVKYWHVTADAETATPANPYCVSHKLADLLPLITGRTRLLAFSACSNLLGSVVPVKEVVAAARAAAKERGARKLEISVDCVAYAPHRRMDVQNWDVDFCVFSLYKVYAAHTAALYVRASTLASSVSSLAHHFLAAGVATKPYKLQPGGPGYELLFGATAVPEYLCALTPAGTLEAAYAAIAAHEHKLLEPLLAFLRAQWERGVRIVGGEMPGPARVPTVSFVVQGQHPLNSRDVVADFDKRGGIGIRYGHFYAYTLVEQLRPKLDLDDAVVRISLVHYNTVEEVQKIIDILKEVLAL